MYPRCDRSNSYGHRTSRWGILNPLDLAYADMDIP